LTGINLYALEYQHLIKIKYIKHEHVMTTLLYKGLPGTLKYGSRFFAHWLLEGCISFDTSQARKTTGRGWLHKNSVSRFASNHEKMQNFCLAKLTSFMVVILAFSLH